MSPSDSPDRTPDGPRSTAADFLRADDARRWEVHRTTGTAAEFHGRDLFAATPAGRPAIWIHEIERPAIVLGSTQADDLVDREAAEASGIEVCRRRSGGGLVLITPGTACWIDLTVPRGDPWWSDDVTAAFDVVGEAMADALHALGAPHPRPHRGPAIDAMLGRAVCFAGVGRGEVLVEGHKVVGLSQRRTRDGARFQTLTVSGWDPSLLEPFVRPELLPPEFDLTGRRVGWPVDLTRLPDAVLAAVRRTPATGIAGNDGSPSD